MTIQRLDTNARLSQATVANGFDFTAGVEIAMTTTV